MLRIGPQAAIYRCEYLVDPNGSDDSAEYYRMDPVPVLLRVPDSG